MPSKPRTQRSKKPAVKSSRKATTSLRPPSESRRLLEEQLAAQGIRPMESLDKFFEETEDFWPKDEGPDEFTDWLKNLRKSGGRG